ncbi:Uncharacterised protein [Mycobacterium tuberculosis]|nr:Uncharacterised protein [Mycobacterium tuberculosis]
MRQAAGELSHSLQLLALAQLLARGIELGLALLLVGDVARGGIQQTVVGHGCP